MNLSPLIKFVVFESFLIILGFAIAAQVLPPDPFTQVISTLVILAITLPLSYWLAYKRD
jgi:hypothetical protein